MPSLKEIKGRIASVNSTRKITSAMKMVASSKLQSVSLWWCLAVTRHSVAVSMPTLSR